eukprot:TRINITY_DN65584_c0_g1_i1.p1 TRINITY_DN65584_c0_g1~~TRINITY_DN65584_c0_g1_i1.p1  ORF type:complete len:356 (-),score=53.06 TRINITY_DN65584_c0_g1_i1:104-1171(-)
MVQRNMHYVVLLLLHIQCIVGQSCIATPSDALGDNYQATVPRQAGVVCALSVPGQKIQINGFTRSSSGCTPVGNVQLELWQADNSGNYDNRAVTTTHVCRSTILSDATGRYSFTSVYPGRHNNRPNHIHLRATAAGYNTLTTQLYFSDDTTACDTTTCDLRYMRLNLSNSDIRSDSFDIVLTPNANANTNTNTNTNTGTTNSNTRSTTDDDDVIGAIGSVFSDDDTSSTQSSDDDDNDASVSQTTTDDDSNDDDDGSPWWLGIFLPLLALCLLLLLVAFICFRRKKKKQRRLRKDVYPPYQPPPPPHYSGTNPVYYHQPNPTPASYGEPPLRDNSPITVYDYAPPPIVTLDDGAY